MARRTNVFLFVFAVLFAVLAGPAAGAAKLAVAPDGPAGTAADSPHLAGAPGGDLADTPHLAAAADAPHLPAAQPDEVEITDHPKTPEELLARMAKAREAIRTVDVTYRATARVHWDVRLEANLMIGLDVPLREGSSLWTFEHRLCIDGPRWRWERRTGPQAAAGPAGEPSRPGVSLHTCDGVESRYMELLEDEVQRMGSTGSPGIWGRILPDRPGGEGIDSWGSIGRAPKNGKLDFHAFRPLSDFHQGPWVHPLVGELGRLSLAEPAASAGETCYRLIVDIAAHRYTYYVSPEHDWAPVRMTLEIADPSVPYLRDPVDGHLCPFPLDEQEWEIHYRRHPSGLWYPCELTGRGYGGYGPLRQLASEGVSVVESVTLNEPLADGLFTIGFPDGLPVTTQRRGVTARIKWDSSLSPEELYGLFGAAAGRRLGAQLEAEAAQKQYLAQMGINLLGPGERAPVIDLTALDGSPVASADLRGRWVLLAFWSAADADCLAVLPRLKALHERFARAGRFAIVGLGTDIDPELLEAAVAEHELPWTQVWLDGDAGLAVQEAHGVKEFPWFFLITPDGYVDAASPDVEAAADAVEQALADPDDESAQ